MHYSKNLNFEEEPDYKYLLTLFTSLADKEKIDLNDNMYDWSVRAVTLKNHSNFYDFIKNQESHPFNNRGRFALKNMSNFGKYDAREEELIYKEAIKFKFEEPKQLTKLVRKEEMKRLKSRKFMNVNKKNNLQE